MIWNLILLGPIALVVVGLLHRKAGRAALAKREAIRKGGGFNAYASSDDYRNRHEGDVAFVWAIVIFAIWFIASSVLTGIMFYKDSSVAQSAQLVEAKTTQRDDLLDQVKGILSPEQYALLLAATPDADVLVILGSGASDIMIQRAQLVVRLNKELYDLQNRILSDRIAICAYSENPIIPRLLVSPGC